MSEIVLLKFNSFHNFEPYPFKLVVQGQISTKAHLHSRFHPLHPHPSSSDPLSFYCIFIEMLICNVRVQKAQICERKKNHCHIKYYSEELKRGHGSFAASVQMLTFRSWWYYLASAVCVCILSLVGYHFPIIAVFLGSSRIVTLFLQTDTTNYVAVLNYLYSWCLNNRRRSIKQMKVEVYGDSSS